MRRLIRAHTFFTRVVKGASFRNDVGHALCIVVCCVLSSVLCNPIFRFFFFFLHKINLAASPSSSVQFSSVK